MPLFTLAMRFPDTDDRRSEVRAQHRNYLDELQHDGKLIAAGPWDHERGALIVFQADTADEVRRMLADDPYVAQGILTEAELHEWQPVIGGAKTLA
jgi:uncharacterized protein YciI